MASLTIKQMHQGLRLAVQQVDANYLDGIVPGEIDYYLNEAIIEKVKSLFSGLTADLRGFEQSQERIDDLQPLVVDDADPIDTEYAGSPVKGFHVDRASLPEDYLFMIAHRSIIEYDPTGQTEWPSEEGSSRSILDEGGSPSPELFSETVFNRTVQSDDVYRLLKDPYNRTSFREPFGRISDEHLNVYTDDLFVVPQVRIDYIREPATVLLDRDNEENSVDCDLPGHLHNRIVREASAMLLQNLQQFDPQRGS